MKAYEHKTMTVQALIEKLQRTYPNQDAVIVFDLWDEDDIKEIASEMNVVLSSEDCRVVSAWLDDNMDKNISLPGNRIKQGIREVIDLKLI